MPRNGKRRSAMVSSNSRTQAARPLTHIDGVAVSQLIEKYGSPLFVFSEKKLVEKVVSQLQKKMMLLTLNLKK